MTMEASESREWFRMVLKAINGIHARLDTADDPSWKPGETRVSREFYNQLAGAAEGLDQHDHVKIKTDYGYVYFAIGNEPPVGDDSHYDEVVPE